VADDRHFHEARWCEPLIMEKGTPNERGILVPEAEKAVQDTVGQARLLIPENLRRKEPPQLPELSQMQVLRHYLHLSQETLGTDVTIDIGLGTCTMKYSPKVHETLVRSAGVSQVHPYQDEDTIQGLLQIFYETGQYLQEISGMDQFTLQPSSGTQAIYAAVAIMKAYHRDTHPGEVRDEIITTMLSHPGNPGAAATVGYKVVTLNPGANGLPDMEQLKSAVSERTAGVLITNPEDTGIFNPRIHELVDLVHKAGGLCFYDQANQNGLFGITRAREAGFDMCHFNLHKTFSSPHGSHGPGAGALGVREFLAKYLPVPVVVKNGERYQLDYDRPDSIGKLRKFFGVAPVVVRAYAYIRSMGADGLEQVSKIAILNNNYMIKRMEDIPGLSLPWAPGVRRLEQARFSWEELTRDTGVTTDDINRRIVDYGFQTYFTSHHPRLIPEPLTPEPAETYSKDDIDRFVSALQAIAREAYREPETVKTAPHKAALPYRGDPSYLTDIRKFACTWRAFRKKQAKGED
jgi:glycine dehydrogenase subunit 2